MEVLPFNCWSNGQCPVVQGEVRCEQPNASLYTFTGNLVLSPPLVQEEQTVPLSQASLLLRGSSLRNTKYVLGAVVFAGHESKVSLALDSQPDYGLVDCSRPKRLLSAINLSLMIVQTLCSRVYHSQMMFETCTCSDSSHWLSLVRQFASDILG